MLEDIYDIKPPVALEAWPGWWWIGAAGLLALLLGLALWQARRTAPRSSPPALARAMARLKAASPGLDDRTFAYHLAICCARPLTLRTGLVTASQTTEELLPRLSATDLPQALCKTIAVTLRRCDQARYAPPSWPPKASSPHPRHPHQRDLILLRRLLGRNRPWPF
jgi:hypothetical protein